MDYKVEDLLFKLTNRLLWFPIISLSEFHITSK